MPIGSVIRYRTGKALEHGLRLLLRTKLMPFGKRFPVGVCFPHDLQRFLGAPPVLILDVGANCGSTVAYYRSFWNRCTIHAFEPIPATYDKLCARFRKDNGVHAHCLALGAKDESVNIQPHHDSEQHSLLNTTGDDDIGIPVRVRALDGLAIELGLGPIDFLKIDVEGFEIEVLQGAEQLLHEKRIRSIYAECRYLRSSATQTLFEDLDRYLTNQGMLFSGFYGTYRWGPSKAFAAFSNGLWLLPEAIAASK